MSGVPNYTQTLSLRLSEVLADIGLDETNILKRRRSFLLQELLRNLYHQINDDNMNVLFLGSQTEGSTTTGLRSDLDMLSFYPRLYAIQKLSDQVPGAHNLLMIQNDTVPPGYCLLQVLQPENSPFPKEHTYKDGAGTCLLKNSAASLFALSGEIIHGPANSKEGRLNFLDTDRVFAIRCTTWPQQAEQWIDQQSHGQWPSTDMKQYCKGSGCLVVGVGCKDSANEHLEWRISTSLAERCLMFNLNITQIRCYILMKMILKTFINPKFNDVISSYMCKTSLFHCIGKTHPDMWRENNLLSCLLTCLSLLCRNVTNENCPHFIIPGNNLMRGKILPAGKPGILEILNNIINSPERALHEIQYDGLGARLSGVRRSRTIVILPASACLSLQMFFVNNILDFASTFRRPEEAARTLKHTMSTIVKYHSEGLEKIACNLLVRWYCITLGSILASGNIRKFNAVTADAHALVKLGRDTDVASSKLKQASILYCVQDMHNADVVLREIERDYDQHIVEPVFSCCCSSSYDKRRRVKEDFVAICDIHSMEEAVKFATATCVIFTPLEIECTPKELRYEMFRCTKEERMLRKEEDDWMDCAVVDCLPFLYFLQYKVNSNLGRNDDKKSALSKLFITLNGKSVLGHRETAFNLLGKCFEQEERVEDALQCYSRSLNIRRRNNVAKIHIATLLSGLINSNAKEEKVLVQ